MRMSKREIAAKVLEVSGLGRLVRKVMPWNGLLVFNYHRVGDDSGSRFNRDIWSTTEEGFDAQLRFFKSNFDVIGQDDLPDVLGRKSGRHIQITFDDGYRDNYEIAYPLLKSHGLSATFFIATGMLDRPRVPWWDEVAWIIRGSTKTSGGGGGAAEPDRIVQSMCLMYRALSAEKREAFLDFLGEAMETGRPAEADAKDLWMTWDMVREMRKGGMRFGGHTVSHAELARLAREEQEREIKGCKERLEVELGEPMTTFSYPYGENYSFNADTLSCLREIGVTFAYSYYGGFQDHESHTPLDLKRFAMERHLTPALCALLTTVPRLWKGT
jgi:peptidoglycan/xylan/chitin deacetylase (PgdA/CDA1 family)